MAGSIGPLSRKWPVLITMWDVYSLTNRVDKRSSDMLERAKVVNERLE
jgi:hypothetical protein